MNRVFSRCRIASLLFACLYSTARLAAQDLEFGAGRPIFSPLLADPKETRIAVFNFLEGNALSLDIGSTTDLLRLRTADSLRTVSFGADFGTFTLLTKRADFRFPVDAVDYLFGVNFGYRQSIMLGNVPSTLSARLRFSHISAHFVDGHYDSDREEWFDDRRPFVYSREFLNLVLALESAADLGGIRLGGRAYLGAELLVHTIPEGFAAAAYQAGLELVLPRLGQLALAPYSAVDFKLTSLGDAGTARLTSAAFSGVTAVHFGVKIGELRERGVRLALTYQSGLETRGMYYDRRIALWTLGALIDF